MKATTTKFKAVNPQNQKIVDTVKSGDRVRWYNGTLTFEEDVLIRKSDGRPMAQGVTTMIRLDSIHLDLELV